MNNNRLNVLIKYVYVTYKYNDRIIDKNDRIVSGSKYSLKMA